jgi:hypothetical protein
MAESRQRLSAAKRSYLLIHRCSGANAEIGGLESGKKYWFRVRALGSAGMMSDWSDPICILIS